MGAIIEHTLRKNELTTKKLLRCPKCGLIGEKRNLGNGLIMYIHVVEEKGSKRLGRYQEIIEACYIPDEKEKSPHKAD